MTLSQLQKLKQIKYKAKVFKVNNKDLNILPLAGAIAAPFNPLKASVALI